MIALIVCGYVICGLATLIVLDRTMSRYMYDSLIKGGGNVFVFLFWPVIAICALCWLLSEALQWCVERFRAEPAHTQEPTEDE